MERGAVAEVLRELVGNAFGPLLGRMLPQDVQDVAHFLGVVLIWRHNGEGMRVISTRSRVRTPGNSGKGFTLRSGFQGNGGRGLTLQSGFQGVLTTGGRDPIV
eukprot:6951484-Pyramimonas_sp.AAC.1